MKDRVFVAVIVSLVIVCSILAITFGVLEGLRVAREVANKADISPSQPPQWTSYPIYAPPSTTIKNPSQIPWPVWSPSQSIQPASEPRKIPSNLPSTPPRRTLPSMPPGEALSTSPSIVPSDFHTQTLDSTSFPSISQIKFPHSSPSAIPTSDPSLMPSALPSTWRSKLPSTIPSAARSALPSRSSKPSTRPSSLPSTSPTIFQSSLPSNSPSIVPRADPSKPPSMVPSIQPSYLPSKGPSNQPNQQPSTGPSESPSTLPTVTVTRNFRDILTPIAFFEGAEFDDPTSYQSSALAWLEQDEFSATISLKRVIQRYALACLYFATFEVRTAATDQSLGEGVKPTGWINSDRWLQGDECGSSDNEQIHSWFGINCDENGFVISINLASNGLSGSFCPETALLRNSLKYIDIYNNTIYNTGEIGNAFLGSFHKLEVLLHGRTWFEYDGIPPHIGQLSNLVQFDCSYTLYFGPLKGTTFRNLQKLRYLDISGNNYNSSIPIELGQLQQLEFFYAQFASLQGDLQFMKPMENIKECWLDRNPDLGGPLPTFLGMLSTLRSFSITRCGFSGQMPTELGMLEQMEQLWMYDNILTGTIVTELGNLSKLRILEIEENMITGTMPDEICAIRRLDGLNVLEADCGGTSQKVDCKCCTCCSNCAAIVEYPAAT